MSRYGKCILTRLLVNSGSSKASCRNVVSKMVPPSRRLSSAAAAAANAQGRLDLATAYRALDKLGLSEGVCNHLSLMVPTAAAKQRDGEDVMLLIPYGLHWSQVTASSLLGLTRDNSVAEGTGQAETTAATIHRGVHEICPGATCVMHTHMPYATALACLEEPKLEMIHQNSLRFYKGVAYDSCYNGLSEDLAEGERLARCLGTDTTLFMANHGVIVTGRTVAEAFDKTYFLERACMHQVLAMSTGRKLKLVDPKICEKTYNVFMKDVLDYADCHFRAVQRDILENDPRVAQ
ncbi:putative aldolase class 2 protein CC_1201 [Tubulanus polymorphus]|uniref:putative aldolase class 2 protein CC_1201 n=1 Tax=Tubulanus polymorphus TaxID=672921 RepID=UPI003DA327E3